MKVADWMYCLFESHLGTQVLYQISRAHSAAYYSHSPTYYVPHIIHVAYTYRRTLLVITLWCISEGMRY